jgi:hypothetical protein
MYTTQLEAHQAFGESNGGIDANYQVHASTKLLARHTCSYGAEEGVAGGGFKGQHEGNANHGSTAIDCTANTCCQAQMLSVQCTLQWQ